MFYLLQTKPNRILSKYFSLSSTYILNVLKPKCTRTPDTHLTPDTSFKYKLITRHKLLNFKQNYVTVT